MSFSSKIAVVIASAAILSPVAASANPVSTGSTAAAVSIKFNKCCSTSGEFNITPGVNASGGGVGVSELSAAVATGETLATAQSSSSKFGTAASAHGYSAPVYFSYSTEAYHLNQKNYSQYENSAHYEHEAALTFAAHSGKEWLNKHAAASAEHGKLEASKKKFSAEYGKEAQLESLNQGTETKTAVVQGNQSSYALEKHSGLTTAQKTENGSKTTYHYYGPSAGLKYLPASH
jgi:hypothetical protein